MIPCSVSFVPTFETEPHEEKTIVNSDGVDLYETDLESVNLCFIFILDRSGSMGGHGIRTAKEALKLFVRSLPTGCTFSIISFGTEHSFLEINGETVF